MTDPLSRPTQRFSNRVANYVRFRPHYPQSVIGLLERETGLSADSAIADVGSGTGHSARPFLRHGNVVYGVEPNEPMRRAAEALLAAYARFHSVVGTAEETTLPDEAVDYVIAGQAFHWFDRVRARAEFARALRPGGWVVVMWNTRRTDASPLMQSYEALMSEFGSDYRQVRHDNIGQAEMEAFFHPVGCTRHTLPNEQQLNLEGLTGRVLSSSYLPLAGQPRHAELLAAVELLFAEHQHDGRVRLKYEIEVYVGRMGREKSEE